MEGTQEGGDQERAESAQAEAATTNSENSSPSRLSITSPATATSESQPIISSVPESQPETTASQSQVPTAASEVKATESAPQNSASTGTPEVTAVGGMQAFVGRRIDSQGSVGTVLFAGGLQHNGRPAGSESQAWLGIDWDDPQRGKHNGTVNGYQYFTTRSGETSGSLIKLEKAEFGITLLEGVFQKYFKDNIPDDLKKKIMAQIEQGAEGKNESAAKSGDGTKTDDGQQPQEQAKKNVLIEFDDNVYFETSKKHKKMVEFYGFDRIWDRLNNMRELADISLARLTISNIGEQGYFRRLLPNLRVLSLEANLLYDWHQIFQIGHELQHLQELSISRNRLRPLQQHAGEISEIVCLSNGKTIPISPRGIFKCLRVLNLIEMSLTWRDICLLLPAFPAIEQLFLCRNSLRDTQNLRLPPDALQKLNLLNLESTDSESFEPYKVFGDLPNLEKLILNKNPLKQLGKINNFARVTHVSLETCALSDARVLTELSQFQALQYLNIKHNPMADKYGKNYVRQRAVAENVRLTGINGSELKKYERKDNEIFYLRRTFDDYFQERGVTYYEYDFEDFMKWVTPLHPAVQRLLAIYGNPYEMQPKIKPQNNVESESVAKNVMLRLHIVVAAGPFLGKKEPIIKKFPDNTSIGNLKNVFSKLLQIPAEKQFLYYKINANDPMELLEEDHKLLNYYGIKDDSELIVDEKVEDS